MTGSFSTGSVGLIGVWTTSSYYSASGSYGQQIQLNLGVSGSLYHTGWEPIQYVELLKEENKIPIGSLIEGKLSNHIGIITGYKVKDIYPHMSGGISPRKECHEIFDTNSGGHIILDLSKSEDFNILHLEEKPSNEKE